MGAIDDGQDAGPRNRKERRRLKALQKRHPALPYGKAVELVRNGGVWSAK